METNNKIKTIDEESKKIYFSFLDGLRSQCVNMSSSAPRLAIAFCIKIDKADEILSEYLMEKLKK